MTLKRAYLSLLSKVGCQVVVRNGCIHVLRRHSHLERVRWGEVVPALMQLCKGAR